MSTSEDALKKLHEAIESIPDDEIVTPTMPVADVIGEAEELLKNAAADRDVLIKSGLDAALIDSLSDRIAAYAKAEANHNAVAFAKSEARKEWEKLKPEADDIKQTLIHSLRFVFKRNNMNAELKSVAEISKGKGYRDLVMDLMELHTLAEKYTDMLAKVGVDNKVINDANVMFGKLRKLLGDINTQPKDVAAAKKTAQKAYTYLWQAVDEIREVGQFAFWKDEKKADLYRSDFYQNIGRSSHAGNDY